MKTGIASGRRATKRKPWGTPAYGYRKTAEGRLGRPSRSRRSVLQRIFNMRVEQGMGQVRDRPGS